MKQLIGHTSKSNNDDKGDGAMLNAAETVLDQKPNDVAHNVINCQESLQDQHEDKEQPITSLFDSNRFTHLYRSYPHTYTRAVTKVKY